MGTILVTGARGQIGSDLVEALRERHGAEAVIETDLAPGTSAGAYRYEQLDVRHRGRLEELVRAYDVEVVYHLASLLSANGEQQPDLAWSVNVEGLRNVLEVARQYGLRVFWPSSIAAFGPETPRLETPQTAVLDPVTMYGITKVSGELLCRYYAERHGLDVRSLRYPGIVSYSAPPGGGTTDYAVAIFHAALEAGRYACFLRPETRLPMMYMPDAVRATLELMEAEPEAITVRTSYNVTAMSFSCEELAAAVCERIPGCVVTYEPDFRQAIADSWPASIDDSRARADWGWKPAFDLEAMADDMFANLRMRREGVST